MRIRTLAAFSGAVSIATIAFLTFGQAADFDPTKAGYPGAVALSQNSNGGWVYKQFPQLVNLYVRDGDRPGKSTCDDSDGCASAWPPLFVVGNEHPVGDWAIIVRDDGNRQWVYKNRPVYRRFHDLPDDPSTSPEKEGFHLLQP